MTLGDVISQYRAEHRMSMDRFAELSGISKAYISILERNRTSRGDEPSPSYEMYKSVARAIGADVDDLIRTVEGKISLVGLTAARADTEELPTNRNVLRLAGRDGSYLERTLTDDQLRALTAILDQMPDVSDDL